MFLLSQALVEEVDWLLRSEVQGAAASAVWTSEEVQTFCHAVKRYVHQHLAFDISYCFSTYLYSFPFLVFASYRYGDNIRKVWELRFQQSKKLAEVQIVTDSPAQ